MVHVRRLSTALLTVSYPQNNAARLSEVEEIATYVLCVFGLFNPVLRTGKIFVLSTQDTFFEINAQKRHV